MKSGDRKRRTAGRAGGTSQSRAPVDAGPPPAASPGMSVPSIRVHTDAWALVVLLVASLLASAPMWQDGHLTYVDNPAHLAEIHDMAFESQNGWSQLAYCGFPLGSMHSPLWYGGLTLVARTGLPMEWIYAFCVWLGFMAPALALYFIARRRLAVIGAFFLASLLLLQRTALIGLGSAMAGMWTSYLGAAGVLLLVDRISRPCRTLGDLAQLAGLVAFSALTHLYTLLPMLVLGVIHLVLRLRAAPPERRRLGLEAAAGVLGALVATAYWVQPLLVRAHAEILPNDQTLSALWARLVLPLSIIETSRLPAFEARWLLEGAPMVLLTVFGLLGVVVWRARRSSLALYGVLLLAGMVTLLVIASMRDLPFMGNFSWRMLYYVRLGLALAAIPMVAWCIARFPVHRVVVGVLALLVCVMAWWSGRQLQPYVLSRQAPQVAEVQAVWEWLRDNRQPSWGRVYVQDTFGSGAVPFAMRNSHLLALTARETGVEQVGAFYGGMPLRTTNWTMSEFGRFFGRPLDSAQRIEEALQNAAFANSTHLLVSNPQDVRALTGTQRADVLFRAGGFAVLQLRDRVSSWVFAEDAGVMARRRAPGFLEIELQEAYPGGVVLASEAFHPFWRAHTADGTPVPVEAAAGSRLTTLQAPAGPATVVLQYSPPRWPWIATLLGAVALGALLVLRRRPLPV